MMMPANYSAVAENEVIYGGASLLDTIGDSLPAVWTTANVRTLSNNLITFVSNTVTSHVVNAVLGTMFGGNWGGDSGLKLFGDNGSITALFKYADYGTVSGQEEMSGLNKFMRVLGVAASVYTLGTQSAKSYVGSAKTIHVDGTFTKY